MIISKLMLQRGALNEAAKAFAEIFPGKKPLVIEDTNTKKVAGDYVVKNFGGCDTYVFDGSEVYADDKHVDIVRDLLLKDSDYIAVAVGAGTINDLCKRASYVAGERQYMCIATAPSVDGFTSNGASITDKGLKVTLSCPAPLLVIADPDILSDAPMPMIASGYGDLAAKVPAGADWFIADILGIEKIDRKVWEMVQPALKEKLSSPKALKSREPSAIGAVFDGLIHTGFAMQEYFDSRPASGYDHLQSHVWEMNDSCEVDGKAASHGFKVAIGTLSSTACMEEILKLSKEDIKKQVSSYVPQTWDERQASIRQAVKIPSVQDRQIEICSKKFLEGEKLKKRQQEIIEKWDLIKEKIKGQIIPFVELKKMFSEVDCPTEPVMIGLSNEDHIYGMRVAQMMRNRYTVCDLLYETGLLDKFISIVTNPANGYFSSWR
ncbi:sn-glycerol-1-phosphate dehydrogenase [Treponema parvum]|uniref:Sn-glycerol-1-phosphate dehydrogenase n=1 Tax=Treponema parvum TaxID=138851 RepID=A0A975IDB8_9SPIR|nr:sn-glycerol-1-phosphate dehydrogenase [Treponema parvum]QTQ12613.1 sn-glycerol-1-phosphate dehydrogenase [Treponema parvum]